MTLKWRTTLTQMIIDLPIFMLSSLVKDKYSLRVLLNNMLFCRPFNIFIFNALISFEQLWICVCYLNGETFMNNYGFVFVIYILIIPYTEIFDIIK